MYRFIISIVILCSFLNASLLYKTSYPDPSFGEQNAGWNTFLENALEGYKTRYIDAYDTGLVHDPSRGSMSVSGSVSEGTGYGLLIFLWGNQQEYFDALWTSANVHQKSNKLFKWIISTQNAAVNSNAATDADEDIALALLFADRLKNYGYTSWNASSIEYGGKAQEIINSIYEKEISNNYLYPDDVLFFNDDFNASYFSPATYKIFAQFDNSSTHNWKGVIDQGYTILAANPGYANGLAPDWCNFDGSVPSNVSGRTTGPSGTGSDFWYDAIRTPYRLALDSLWYSDSRAVTFLDAGMSWVNATTVQLYELDKTASGSHTAMTTAMWGAGAYGSSSGAQKTAFYNEMGDYDDQGNFFGDYATAHIYYYNQSLAWLGTAVMNGAAVNVFDDLSITPDLKYATQTDFKVTSLNSYQIVVTDNDGWNNIARVTIDIIDKNSKKFQYLYVNEYGTRNFQILDSSLLSQNSISYAGDDKILTFNFDFQIIITNNFFPGSIDVTVKAEDYQYNVLTITTENFYYNMTPTINVTGTSAHGFYPTVNNNGDQLTLQVTKWLDDDKINTFSWNFGDGTITPVSNTANINHSYAISVTGEVVITFQAVDFYGATANYTKTIWVNPKPVAGFSVSEPTTNLDLILTFNASASTDNLQINTYNFNFGDGTLLQTNNFIVTHSFSSAGTKNITLNVIDNYGRYSDTVALEVYINYNPSPEFTFLPLTANSLETISLDASSSTDDDHTSIISYEWTIPDLNTVTTGITTDIVIVTSGYHQVILRVTDNWGARGTITKNLYVNYPPTANFNIISLNRYVPCPITFDASIAADFDDSIVSYYWSFGDGNTGNGQTVAHMYVTPDTKDITLLIADSFGATDSITASIKLFSTIYINDVFYVSIQEAINNAASGNVISIDADNYNLSSYEENLVITKSLKLLNESSTKYIRLNASNNQAILITGNNINVELDRWEIFNGDANLGGGIYQINGTLKIDNSYVHNSTANRGGGIYLSTVNFEISNTILSANVARNLGGGIYAQGSSLLASSINALSNLASTYSTSNGGALYLADSTLSLTHSVISKNQSKQYGGGLFSTTSTVNIHKTIFSNNSILSSGTGGGIMQLSGITTINYSKFEGNQANLSYGGAIAAENGLSILYNNLIINNNASFSGGAIYLNSSVLFETNDTVLYNTAGVVYGIHAQNYSTVNIRNSLYYHTADDVFIEDNGHSVTINNTAVKGISDIPNNRNTENLVINVDPIVSGNYSLTAYSPFIDFGVSAYITGLVTSDYNGDPRVTNNQVDIGCMETYDAIPPVTPSWVLLVDHVTINEHVTLNGVCSTDINQFSISGVTVEFIYTSYNTTFLASITLNTLSRNELYLTVQDRAGNRSGTLSITITQDALPIPSLNVTYTTSNYSMQAVFDARGSLPGADPADSLATINTYSIVFADGSTSSNSSGLFTFVVADMINQLITLNLVDNYSLTDYITQNINPPTYLISSTLNLMSFPMTFSNNMVTVLQTTNVRVWLYDVSLSPTYNEPAQTSYFSLGKGYWVYAPNGAQLESSTRSYLALTDEYTIQIKEGWNLVGNPFTKDLQWNSMLFKDGATTYSKADAFTNGLIYTSQIWGYDKAAGGAYEPYILTSSIRIWKGYWIYAAKDLDMIITTNALAGLHTLEVEDSKVALMEILITSNTFKSKLVLGKADKESSLFDPRIDLLPPPKYPKQNTEVYVEDHGLKLIEHYRPENNLKWSFTIDNQHNPDPIRISFNPLLDTKFKIYDEFNNLVLENSVTINGTGIYTYQVEAITIYSTPISNFVAYPNPFNPLSSDPNKAKICFEYDLSSNSDIELLIYNIAGRKVHQVNYASTDGEGSSGNDLKIYWDGKDINGKSMGSGLYFYVFVTNGVYVRKGKIVLWNE